MADPLLASELPGLIDHWTGPVTYTHPDGEVEAGVCWSYGYIYLIHERRLAEPGIEHRPRRERVALDPPEVVRRAALEEE